MLKNFLLELFEVSVGSSEDLRRNFPKFLRETKKVPTGISKNQSKIPQKLPFFTNIKHG
jgi:hypothetical protein